MRLNVRSYVSSARRYGLGAARMERQLSYIKIIYDRQVDAAYTCLTGHVSSKSARMYVCDPVDVDGMINLDLDVDDRLIRIEAFVASSKLPQQWLDVAEQTDAESA